MRQRLTMIFLLAGGLVLGSVPLIRSQAAVGHSAPKSVRVGSVTWLSSLDEAKRLAAQQHKPILVFSLFGRLDEEFC